MTYLELLDKQGQFMYTMYFFQIIQIVYLSERGDGICLAAVEGGCGPLSSDDALEARLISSDSTRLPRLIFDGSFISTEPLQGQQKFQANVNYFIAKQHKTRNKEMGRKTKETNKYVSCNKTRRALTQQHSTRHSQQSRTGAMG